MADDVTAMPNAVVPPADAGSSTLAVSRVRYLEAAYNALRGALLPKAPPVHETALAWSFPSRGARGAVIGECLHGPIQGSHERVAIMIHPREWARADVDVLAVLAHEMIHAQLGPGVGHRGAFGKIAHGIGLEGPATATVPGEAFKRFCEELRDRLPPFPAGGIAVAGRPKDGTRLRLWECGCGVKVRVARDDFAATCNRCGEPFELKQPAKPRTAGPVASDK